LEDAIYKFEPFSTDSCLMFLPAIYQGLNSKVIEIEGIIVRNRQKNETGVKISDTWKNGVALTLGHAIGVMYQCNSPFSIDENVIVDLVTTKGWKMKTLYDSILYECEGGWTNETVGENIGLDICQEEQPQTVFCGILDDDNWKDPILEGRTITIFDPTGESAKVSLDNPEVKDGDVKDLLEIFRKYKKALAAGKRMTGPVRNFSFKIPQKDSHTPIVTTRPYPMNPVAGKEADRQIDKLFENGMIELSVSNYNSPLVLVKKPNNQGFRLCVNYIKLNRILQHVFYPVPCIETLLSDLHNEKLKSTLDLQDAF